jgi:mono/diheme cytochrome c family protein
MNAATRAMRRPRALVQVFLAMAVTAAGVLAVTQARADEETERGRALAEKLCAVCHLNPGQGDKTGPGTIPGFAAVAKRPDQTLEGIMDWLRSVPPMMPDHHLSQDEMEAIAFYILSLQQQSGS